jgi:glutathione peroxidase
MGVRFLIPSPLRPLVDGRDRVPIDTGGATVGQALAALFDRHPELKLRIVTEQGEVRPHVNVFVGNESIRDTGGLDSPITDGVEIAIIPAVSGGTAASLPAGARRRPHQADEADADENHGQRTTHQVRIDHEHDPADDVEGALLQAAVAEVDEADARDDDGNEERSGIETHRRSLAGPWRAASATRSRDDRHREYDVGMSLPHRLLAAAAVATSLAAVLHAGGQMPDSFYSMKTKTLQGKPADLSAYKGKVTLVVNVASKCGFTPQYTGLEKLHEDLKGRGFSVLGFPSNDFGGQEPGTPEEIATFCKKNYGVTFPIFEKVVTKAGPDQSPIYTFLGKDGSLPAWNFSKYLVGKDGKVIAFYPSKVTPDSKELRDAIDAALR